MAMNHNTMKRALAELDCFLPEKMKLLIGGGAAFVLAHRIPLATMDIDGIPYQTTMTLPELDIYVKKVATKCHIPSDWLNPYFSSFTFSLPADYGQRLVAVYEGTQLTALALGKEDLVIMKCFAGRAKDVSHVAALLKQGLDTDLVLDHLTRCIEKNLPNAQKAEDFFYEICDQVGIAP